MNWPAIVAEPNHPISVETLLRFEQHLGVSLPLDYGDFLLVCNGGAVIEHTLETTIEGYLEQTAVFSLFPLMASSPHSEGVMEFRSRWHTDKVGLEVALPIGNDGGTGFFFLMLSPRFFGQIYFAYKDEFRANSPDWEAGRESMPEYMGLVSPSFTELAGLISANSGNE